MIHRKFWFIRFALSSNKFYNISLQIPYRETKYFAAFLFIQIYKRYHTCVNIYDYFQMDLQDFIFQIFCIAEILSKTFTDDTNVNVSHGNPLQVKLLWPHYIEHL